MNLQEFAAQKRKNEENAMGLLSPDEEMVWQQFQQGHSTSDIASTSNKESWSVSYVSRVLNRARKKIAKVLQEHARSHRLDVESLLDYKGLLIGFDYQANTQVYIIFTIKLGIVVWYKHESYAGRLCPECPKQQECRQTLEAIIDEYNITLRQDEKELPMTQQSIALFNKLAAKEIPRYQRSVE
ncbi:MAG: hypothetical protein ACFFBU_08910 [Promethearchaeota archaeon]